MKNLTLLSFGALTLAVAASCVSLDLSDPNVCDSKTVSFSEPDGLSVACSALAGDPAVGNASYTAPPVSTTTSFDFSGALSDVNKATSNFSIQVNQLMLENANSQFNSVSSVEIDVQGNDTTKYPLVEFAHYTAPETGVGNFMNFTLDMSNSAVLSYLESGPVQLTISVNNAPMTLNQACSVLNTGTITTVVHMCLGAAISYKKSL
jgi:hypothetical protein